ncbi:MAG: PRC-barrel domain-containing protein [Nostocaceae cyanobacterium]|nr:PRC-barrel domain-containing protein [Nostocaceae cyanobacterium]
MTSEQTIRRSDILNTQVITRDNGKRLGIVSQLWVDVEQREVVALSLRDSLISVSGIPRYMYLSSIDQFGDVLLVENEDVIDDVEVDMFSNLINWEVITETGEVLGRVRGFKFNSESGKIYSIVIASLGLPQIPESFLSTYEISMEEVVSTGPNRLIVFEGAEERVNQLTVGLLERLGIGRAPWEREEEEYGYTAPRTVAPSNQLPSGVPLEAPKPKVYAPEPVAKEEQWDEDYYEEEPLPQRQVMQARQYEAVQYEDEEDNWSEATGKDTYSSAQPYSKKAYADEYDRYDDDLDADAWDDAPKPVNIPKKVKQRQPEYEEESGY